MKGSGFSGWPVIDTCCRDNLCLIADPSLSGLRVAKELWIYGKRGCIVSERVLVRYCWRFQRVVATRFNPDMKAENEQLISTEKCKKLAITAVMRSWLSPQMHFCGINEIRHKTRLDQYGYYCFAGKNERAVDELLNEEISDTLDEARRKLAFWRDEDNTVRPHWSLNNQTLLEARWTLEQFAGSAPGARS
jgi:putative transposase